MKRKPGRPPKFIRPRLQTAPLHKLWPRTPTAEKWTWGYEVVDFADGIGRPLLEWQKYAVVHLLELDRPGHMRWRQALLLVGRQNGKTHLVAMIALWAMAVARWPLILGLAQDLSLAEETLNSAYDVCVETGDDGEILPERVELAGLVTSFSRGTGNRALRLGKSRWLAKAGGRAATRGRSADLVIWDELREERAWDTYGAVAPTRLTREEGLLLMISNAGDMGSVVLRTLRGRVLAHLGWPDGPPDEDLATERPDDSICLLEWSSPPDSRPSDLEGVVQANPSYAEGIISRSALEQSLKGPERVVRTEHMCQWVASAENAWLPGPDWAACAVPQGDEDWELAPDGRAIGVAVDPRGEYAALAVAGPVPGQDKPQVEIVAAKPWWDWVVPWLEKHARDVPIVVAQHGWGAQMNLALEERRFKVRSLGGRDIGMAHRRFEEAVRNHAVRHLAQPILDASRAAAIPRQIGEDIVISWRGGAAVVPLYAAVLALEALQGKAAGKRVWSPPAARVTRAGAVASFSGRGAGGRVVLK